MSCGEATDIIEENLGSVSRCTWLRTNFVTSWFSSVHELSLCSGGEDLWHSAMKVNIIFGMYSTAV